MQFIVHLLALIPGPARCIILLNSLIGRHADAKTPLSKPSIWSSTDLLRARSLHPILQLPLQAASVSSKSSQDHIWASSLAAGRRESEATGYGIRLTGIRVDKVASLLRWSRLRGPTKGERRDLSGSIPIGVDVDGDMSLLLHIRSQQSVVSMGVMCMEVEGLL